MFGTTSTHSAGMLAGVLVLLATSIKPISGLPTLSPADSTGSPGQGVPSDIVWPSYVAHLSQAQPDQAFGPKQNAFVYRIPGKSQDIGTQMAFTMQDDDDNDDNDEDLHSFCILSFLDMNKLWGTADWASQIMKGHEFTIFAYLEAVVVFSPEDTWNQHPVVDYGNAIAKVHVNSTGIYMDAGIIACEFKDDMAQFWLQAVEDQSCDLSWAEGMQPLSGLVIQKYVLS